MYLSKKLVKLSELPFQSFSYLGIVGTGLWTDSGKCNIAVTFLLSAVEGVVLAFSKYVLSTVLLHVSIRKYYCCQCWQICHQTQNYFFTKIMSFHILLQTVDVTLRVGCIYINISLNKMRLNKYLNLKFADNMQVKEFKWQVIYSFTINKLYLKISEFV
jgi:hypothetical protein